MAKTPKASVREFKEAVAWFRERVPVPKDVWDDMTASDREKAFTVAGVAQMDVVNQVWKALDKAIAKGESLDSFKTRMKSTLTAAWGQENPARIETIFRTNVQLAYSRGRFEQLSDPDVLETRPFWRFTAIMDSATTPVCREAHGTVLPANHPWWRTHWAPLHHRCRSGVHSLSPEAAAEYGVTKKPTKEKPGEGFGDSEPVEWQPDLDLYPPELVKLYRKRQ